MDIGTAPPPRSGMPTPGPGRNRGPRVRPDVMTTAWMIVAVVVLAIGLLRPSALPQPLWLMVHLVTLAVLTNSIFQWSWFFARALLRMPREDPHASRWPLVRQIAFNVTLVLLVASMWTGWMWGVIAGAALVAAIAAWHGLALLWALRGKLGSRFAVVLRYYVVSAAFLVLGCTLAGFVAVAMFSPAAPQWLLEARDRLTMAHSLANVLGWVGLTIAGTLVTLGPTILHSRLADGTVEWALRALPWLAVVILVGVGGALAGVMPVVGAALLAVALLAGLAIAWPLGRVMAFELSDRPAGPRDSSARPRSRRGLTANGWQLGLGIAWCGLGLTVIAVQLLATWPTPADARNGALPWIALIGAGGLLQILMAALGHLMPVMIGGGPSVIRVGINAVEWAWPARLAVRNGSLLAIMLTPAAASAAHVALWLLVIITFAADIAAFGVTGVRQGRARRTREKEGEARARTD